MDTILMRSVPAPPDGLCLTLTVKAIYCEYFYDGGGASTCDMFLCTRYSNDPLDDWASDFDKATGIIDGPSVLEYFAFEPEPGFDEPDRTIAYGYGHALILAALGEIITATTFRSLPVGFAHHDGQIAYIAQS